MKNKENNITERFNEITNDFLKIEFLSFLGLFLNSVFIVLWIGVK